MNDTQGQPLPTSETDNWESAPTDAPRQKAGEVLERQSEKADTDSDSDSDDGAADRANKERMADDAEAVAERQAADDGSAGSA